MNWDTQADNIDWGFVDFGQMEWDKTVDPNDNPNDPRNIDWGKVGWGEMNWDTQADDIDWLNMQYDELDESDVDLINEETDVVGIGSAEGDLIVQGEGNIDAVLVGLSGADTIDGGQGADTIDGGVDSDSLLGGLGNDSLLGAGLARIH